MSPLKQSNNIAARMGRWSASHWKTAVFGWLAFVIVAVAAGMAVGTKTIDENDANVGEAHRADQILKDAGFQADPQTEIVLIQSKALMVGDPAFRAAVDDVVDSVRPFTAIENLRSPFDAGHADQISKDGHTVHGRVGDEGRLRHGDRAASTRSRPPPTRSRRPIRTSTSARPARSAPARPSTRCSTSSSRRPASARSRSRCSSCCSSSARSSPRASRCCSRSRPCSPRSACVALPSHLVPMDQNVSAVLLLVGLAVGVDYSLFYLKREREERAAGKGNRAALEAAAATSGRSVLISGVTVMIAMAGMLFSGDKTYLSFGIATMMVVAVAMLGSLTVLPGAAVEARRPGREGPDPVPRPAPPRAAARTASGRRSSTPALRHPLVSARRRDGRAARDGAPAAPHPHRPVRARLAAEERRRRSETIDRIQDAVPGRRRPGARRDQGGRRLAGDAAGDRRRCARRRSRAGRCTARSRSTSTRPTPSTRVAIPLAGKGTDDASRTRRCETLRNDGAAGDRRQGPGRDLRGHRRHGGLGGRERAAQALGAARVRLRARRSRSCCCWSRSARS